jgi:hypothetical protein
MPFSIHKFCTDVISRVLKLLFASLSVLTKSSAGKGIAEIVSGTTDTNGESNTNQNSLMKWPLAKIRRRRITRKKFTTKKTTVSPKVGVIWLKHIGISEVPVSYLGRRGRLSWWSLLLVVDGRFQENTRFVAYTILRFVPRLLHPIYFQFAAYCSSVDDNNLSCFLC